MNIGIKQKLKKVKPGRYEDTLIKNGGSKGSKPMAEDSMDSALQLREEWDIAEEKLLDLKRLQRRMSIGSMAGMQQVTVKRLPIWTPKVWAQN